MDASPETTPRVPEFALVTGTFLALSFLVAGLALTGDVVRTLLTAVVVLYPFVAYAVVHSPDPTTVLPPRVTAAISVAVGSVLAGGVLVSAAPDRVAVEAPYALFLGALVVFPPAAYHARYGTRSDRIVPLSPSQVVGVASVVATGVLAYGLLVGGAVFAAATALLSFLAGALYARGRGVRLAARSRRRFVAGGAVTGVGLSFLGVARGVDPAPWLLVGLCVAAGPTLFYALTTPERA